MSEIKLPAGLKPGDQVILLQSNKSDLPLGVTLYAVAPDEYLRDHGDFGVARSPALSANSNFHSDREGTEWRRADPGVRRFRTTKANAIGMGAPIGTKFTLRAGSDIVIFDDPALPTNMGCWRPNGFVQSGDIEELGTAPSQKSSSESPVVYGVRWTPELLAECRNEPEKLFQDLSPLAQEALKAANKQHAASITSITDTFGDVAARFWAGLAGAPAPTPTPTPTPTPEPKKPEPKKEDTMTPIKIETKTFVAGNPIEAYDARGRSDLLQQHQAEIKRLEALEYWTQETRDELAALRAGVEAAVKAFDEDYAARKAAKKTDA